MNTHSSKPAKSHPRVWETPTLRAVGTVGDVLKNGGGKVTVIIGDPGEPRKVPSLDK